VTANTFADCNRVVATKQTATMTSKPIAGRIGIKRNLATGTSIAVGDGNLLDYSWNMDFLPVAFYHPASIDTTVITNGLTWCSQLLNEAGLSEQTKLTASNGFNSKSKCTW